MEGREAELEHTTAGIFGELAMLSLNNISKDDAKLEFFFLQTSIE